MICIIESAFRELKKCRRMPKQTSPVQKPLSHSDVPSSVSSAKTQSAKEKKLCTQKVKRFLFFLFHICCFLLCIFITVKGVLFIQWDISSD